MVRISVVLITAALVYLLAMIIIMHFTSQFAISKKVTPPWVINVSVEDFYKLIIKGAMRHYEVL